MITSRHNPVVREVRSVQRNRPHQAFLLEGPHLLAEALQASLRLSTLLVSPRADGPLVERARRVAGLTLDVSEEIIEYVADSQHPQGIVAVAEVPALTLDEDAARSGRLLLLDEIRDPGNLGAVLRTAWASGVVGALLAGSCVDAWNPKVVRASAGASFHVPVLEFPRRADAGAWLARHGQRAVMAVARGRTSCFEADLRAPITLVLGNEAHGVHEETAAFCADSLYVPMTAGCESLNLAATAAVLCYLALDRARAAGGA